MSRQPYISKSKFLHGLQCPKLLWCDYNAKHLFPEVSPQLQAIFDQGHEVGALAKKLFPNGIEVDVDPANFEGAIELTKDYLPSRRPIFEATFSSNGGYARADILNPVGKNEWNMIEVKSTTRLKDEHIPDVSESERKKVREALGKYCGLDTKGMVLILDALSGQNSQPMN